MFGGIVKIVEYSRENHLSEEDTALLLSSFLDYEIDLSGNGWFDDLTEEQKEILDNNYELVQEIVKS